jgi:MFS superfamily sulfate permease-like transporter
MTAVLASSALTAGPVWRRTLGDGLAGGVTAAVFYAEYIGLGVVLGGALPGPGGAELGNRMVVGAVLVSCLLGAALRQPLLAGPRAASLAVLVAGMKFSSAHTAGTAEALPSAAAALAVMVLVAAAVQLTGLLPRVRTWLCSTPVALRKGFIFSTAVGAVVGLSSAQLDGCFRVSPALTAGVVTLSVALALGWARWCARSHDKPGDSPHWRSALAPLSVLIGGVLACGGYFALIEPSAQAGLCGAIAAAGQQGGQAAEPLQLWALPAALALAAVSQPVWIWPALLLFGALLGLVLLLESLTTLRESRDQTAPALWAAQLKLRALTNLVCAPLCLPCSSLSLVRTDALIASAGRTRLAVLCHGAVLAAMLLFLSDWIGALPQLAVAVVLLLLAVQMIDEDTRTRVWRAGYRPNAAPAGVRNVWVFWAVVAFSLACGSVLHYVGWGFGGGPLMGLLVGTLWTRAGQGAAVSGGLKYSNSKRLPDALRHHTS